MLSSESARPGLLAAAAAERAETAGSMYTLYAQSLLLTARKRGKTCVLAKLVRTDTGEKALAMPYRHRRRVECVSLPPAAIEAARRWGARRWIVRFDQERLCFALALDGVEQIGWLRLSDGRPELFVPIRRFQPIAWTDWEFVDSSITLNIDGAAGGAA